MFEFLINKNDSLYVVSSSSSSKLRISYLDLDNNSLKTIYDLPHKLDSTFYFDDSTKESISDIYGYNNIDNNYLFYCNNNQSYCSLLFDSNFNLLKKFSPESSKNFPYRNIAETKDNIFYFTNIDIIKANKKDLLNDKILTKKSLTEIGINNNDSMENYITKLFYIDNTIFVFCYTAYIKNNFAYKFKSYLLKLDTNLVLKEKVDIEFKNVKSDNIMLTDIERVGDNFIAYYNDFDWFTFEKYSFIYHSTDNGKTFEQKSDGKAWFKDIYNLGISPINDSLIFIHGLNASFYYTKDKGITFSERDSLRFNTNEYSGDNILKIIEHKGDIYIFTYDRVKKSFIIKLNNRITNIEYLEEKSPPTAYPNPSSDYISFDIENSVQSVEIYNYIGEVVLKSDIAKDIDIRSLTNGSYFAKIISNSTEIRTVPFKVSK
jgi:hypothetical protein